MPSECDKVPPLRYSSTRYLRGFLPDPKKMMMMMLMIKMINDDDDNSDDDSDDHGDDIN